MPLAAFGLEARIASSSTPMPRIQAKAVPITTSSAWARGPSAPIAPARARVSTNSPTRSSTPITAAPIAPTKAT